MHNLTTKVINAIPDNLSILAQKSSFISSLPSNLFLTDPSLLTHPEQNILRRTEGSIVNLGSGIKSSSQLGGFRLEIELVPRSEGGRNMGDIF